MQWIKDHLAKLVAGLVALAAGLAFLFYKLWSGKKKEVEVLKVENEVKEVQGKIEEATKMVEVVKEVRVEQEKKVEVASKELDKAVEELKAVQEVKVEEISDTTKYFNDKYSGK